MTLLEDSAECKNFTEVEDIRSFPQGKLALMQIGGATVGRAVFEPGWRWSTSVQPLANTPTCLAPHFQYHVKGILHVVMDDGTEFDCKPGDISYLPMGHLAWTVGDEPVEVIDFQGMIDYAEQQRAKAEKTLNRLIMQSPLPMLVFEHDVQNINPLSNQDFRDLMGFSCAKALSNHRFQDNLGFTAEEITEISDWWNLAFPNEAYRLQIMHEWSNKLQESAQSEISVEPSTVKIQLKNGEVRLFQVHLSRVETQSIAVFVDLTEQALHNAELEKAKQAADQANQAKSEFLANMSHELRTPLNGILGYAQILGRSKTLANKEQHGINIIHQCGSHLLTLINDILDLSKIEARKLELAPKAFHFGSFLQSVVEICQVRAEQKKLTFEYEADPELPQGISVDETRLRQVLINLLGNAIKFTDRGNVKLRVNCQTDKMMQTAALTFTVSDTGVGIAHEDVGKLFQSFEQVGVQHRQSEGTGLGLAISQKIVQLMGGQIQVSSEMSQGSHFFFTITVPIALDWQQQQARVINNPIGYVGEQRKILIIDDRWENRSVLFNLLEPLGFNLLEASNGKEGLDQIQRNQPDLIITDIAMPVMDGFELLKHIRQSEPFKHLKVIVSSASVAQTDQQMALRVGGDDFLPKPVPANALFQILEEHLHLSWMYETSSEDSHEDIAQSDSAEMIAPPLTVLEELLSLAQKGRFKKLTDLVTDIRHQDPRFQVFAEKMLQLAQQYQFDEIEEQLKISLNLQSNV